MKLLMFFLTLFLSFPSYSFDVKGGWVIDVERTIGFNDERSKISLLRRELVKCMADNMFLIYDGRKASLVLKEHYCSFGGKEGVVDEWEVVYDYKVIYEDGDVVIMLGGVGEEAGVEVLNILSDDLMWIYCCGEGPECNEHYRIYYKKVWHGD